MEGSNLPLHKQTNQHQPANVGPRMRQVGMPNQQVLSRQIINARNIQNQYIQLNNEEINATIQRRNALSNATQIYGMPSTQNSRLRPIANQTPINFTNLEFASNSPIGQILKKQLDKPVRNNFREKSKSSQKKTVTTGGEVDKRKREEAYRKMNEFFASFEDNTNLYPTFENPLDCSLDFYFHMQHADLEVTELTHLQKVRNLFKVLLNSNRDTQQIIRDSEYFCREYLLEKSGISFRFDLSSDIPDLIHPPVLLTGYFPYSCISNTQKAEYLCARYKEAVREYQRLIPFAKNEKRFGLTVVAAKAHFLWDFHKEGRHIHGFFYFAKDSYHTYMIDMFNNMIFPGDLPYEAWDERVKVAFDRVSSYNLHLSEVIRSNYEDFKEISYRFYLPYQSPHITKIRDHSKTVDQIKFRIVGQQLENKHLFGNRVIHVGGTKPLGDGWSYENQLTDEAGHLIKPSGLDEYLNITGPLSKITTSTSADDVQYEEAHQIQHFLLPVLHELTGEMSHGFDKGLRYENFETNDEVKEVAQVLTILICSIAVDDVGEEAVFGEQQDSQEICVAKPSRFDDIITDLDGVSILEPEPEVVQTIPPQNKEDELSVETSIDPIQQQTSSKLIEELDEMGEILEEPVSQTIQSTSQTQTETVEKPILDHDYVYEHAPIRSGPVTPVRSIAEIIESVSKEISMERQNAPPLKLSNIHEYPGSRKVDALNIIKLETPIRIIEKTQKSKELLESICEYFEFSYEKTCDWLELLSTKVRKNQLFAKADPFLQNVAQCFNFHEDFTSGSKWWTFDVDVDSVFSGALENKKQEYLEYKENPSKNKKRTLNESPTIPAKLARIDDTEEPSTPMTRGKKRASTKSVSPRSPQNKNIKNVVAPTSHIIVDEEEEIDVVTVTKNGLSINQMEIEKEIVEEQNKEPIIELDDINIPSTSTGKTKEIIDLEKELMEQEMIEEEIPEISTIYDVNVERDSYRGTASVSLHLPQVHNPQSFSETYFAEKLNKDDNDGIITAILNETNDLRTEYLQIENEEHLESEEVKNSNIDIIYDECEVLTDNLTVAQNESASMEEKDRKDELVITLDAPSTIEPAEITISEPTQTTMIADMEVWKKPVEVVVSLKNEVLNYTKESLSVLCESADIERVAENKAIQTTIDAMPISEDVVEFSTHDSEIIQEKEADKGVAVEADVNMATTIETSINIPETIEQNYDRETIAGKCLVELETKSMNIESTSMGIQKSNINLKDEEDKSDSIAKVKCVDVGTVKFAVSDNKVKHGKICENAEKSSAVVECSKIRENSLAIHGGVRTKIKSKNRRPKGHLNVTSNMSNFATDRMNVKQLKKRLDFHQTVATDAVFNMGVTMEDKFEIVNSTSDSNKTESNSLIAPDNVMICDEDGASTTKIVDTVVEKSNLENAEEVGKNLENVENIEEILENAEDQTSQPAEPESAFAMKDRKEASDSILPTQDFAKTEFTIKIPAKPRVVVDTKQQSYNPIDALAAVVNETLGHDFLENFCKESEANKIEARKQEIMMMKPSTSGVDFNQTLESSNSCNVDAFFNMSDNQIVAESSQNTFEPQMDEFNSDDMLEQFMNQAEAEKQKETLNSFIGAFEDPSEKEFQNFISDDQTSDALEIIANSVPIPVKVAEMVVKPDAFLHHMTHFVCELNSNNLMKFVGGNFSNTPKKFKKHIILEFGKTRNMHFQFPLVFYREFGHIPCLNGRAYDVSEHVINEQNLKCFVRCVSTKRYVGWNAETLKKSKVFDKISMTELTWSKFVGGSWTVSDKKIYSYDFILQRLNHDCTKYAVIFYEFPWFNQLITMNIPPSLIHSANSTEHGCPGCTDGTVFLIHYCDCEANSELKANTKAVIVNLRNSELGRYRYDFVGRFICQHGPSDKLVVINKPELPQKITNGLVYGATTVFLRFINTPHFNESPFSFGFINSLLVETEYTGNQISIASNQPSNPLNFYAPPSQPLAGPSTIPNNFDTSNQPAFSQQPSSSQSSGDLFNRSEPLFFGDFAMTNGMMDNDKLTTPTQLPLGGMYEEEENVNYNAEQSIAPEQILQTIQSTPPSAQQMLHHQNPLSVPTIHQQQRHAHQQHYQAFQQQHQQGIPPNTAPRSVPVPSTHQISPSGYLGIPGQPPSNPSFYSEINPGSSQPILSNPSSVLYPTQAPGSQQNEGAIRAISQQSQHQIGTHLSQPTTPSFQRYLPQQQIGMRSEEGPSNPSPVPATKRRQRKVPEEPKQPRAKRTNVRKRKEIEDDARRQQEIQLHPVSNPYRPSIPFTCPPQGNYNPVVHPGMRLQQQQHQAAPYRIMHPPNHPSMMSPGNQFFPPPLARQNPAIVRQLAMTNRNAYNQGAHYTENPNRATGLPEFYPVTYSEQPDPMATQYPSEEQMMRFNQSQGMQQHSGYPQNAHEQYARAPPMMHPPFPPLTPQQYQQEMERRQMQQQQIQHQQEQQNQMQQQEQQRQMQAHQQIPQMQQAQQMHPQQMHQQQIHQQQMHQQPQPMNPQYHAAQMQDQQMLAYRRRQFLKEEEEMRKRAEAEAYAQNQNQNQNQQQMNPPPNFNNFVPNNDASGGFDNQGMFPEMAYPGYEQQQQQQQQHPHNQYQNQNQNQNQHQRAAAENIPIVDDNDVRRATPVAPSSNSSSSPGQPSWNFDNNISSVRSDSYAYRRIDESSILSGKLPSVPPSYLRCLEDDESGVMSLVQYQARPEVATIAEQSIGVAVCDETGEYEAQQHRRTCAMRRMKAFSEVILRKLKKEQKSFKETTIEIRSKSVENTDRKKLVEESKLARVGSSCKLYEINNYAKKKMEIVKNKYEFQLEDKNESTIEMKSKDIMDELLNGQKVFDDNKTNIKDSIRFDMITSMLGAYSPQVAQSSRNNENNITYLDVIKRYSLMKFHGSKDLSKVPMFNKDEEMIHGESISPVMDELLKFNQFIREKHNHIKDVVDSIPEMLHNKNKKVEAYINCLATSQRVWAIIIQRFMIDIQSNIFNIYSIHWADRAQSVEKLRDIMEQRKRDITLIVDHVFDLTLAKSLIVKFMKGPKNASLARVVNSFISHSILLFERIRPSPWLNGAFQNNQPWRRRFADFEDSVSLLTMTLEDKIPTNFDVDSFLQQCAREHIDPSSVRNQMQCFNAGSARATLLDAFCTQSALLLDAMRQAVPDGIADHRIMLYYRHQLWMNMRQLMNCEEIFVTREDMSNMPDATRSLMTSAIAAGGNTSYCINLSVLEMKKLYSQLSQVYPGAPMVQPPNNGFAIWVNDKSLSFSIVVERPVTVINDPRQRKHVYYYRDCREEYDNDQAFKLPQGNIRVMVCKKTGKIYLQILNEKMTPKSDAFHFKTLPELRESGEIDWTRFNEEYLMPSFNYIRDRMGFVPSEVIHVPWEKQWRTEKMRSELTSVDCGKRREKMRTHYYKIADKYLKRSKLVYERADKLKAQDNKDMLENPACIEPKVTSEPDIPERPPSAPIWNGRKPTEEYGEYLRRAEHEIDYEEDGEPVDFMDMGNDDPEGDDDDLEVVFQDYSFRNRDVAVIPFTIDTLPHLRIATPEPNPPKPLTSVTNQFEYADENDVDEFSAEQQIFASSTNNHFDEQDVVNVEPDSENEDNDSDESEHDYEDESDDEDSTDSEDDEE